MSKFTIGSDPELFLQDTTGKLIASVGKFGGTKENPRPVLGGAGFAIQEDNVALEFNIPPSSSKKAFVESLSNMMAFVTQEAARRGLKPALLASATFTEDQLETEQAKLFGCEPDFNAWTGQENPRPEGVDKNLRSCGGHVHVGMSGSNPIVITRAMDLYLGVPSVLLDKDSTRRSLYGNAGSFRPTMYGIEYRVLSNFWLRSKKQMAWVYDQTERALEHAMKYQGNPMEFLLHEAKAIQSAINGGKESIAASLMEKYAI